MLFRKLFAISVWKDWHALTSTEKHKMLDVQSEELTDLYIIILYFLQCPLSLWHFLCVLTNAFRPIQFLFLAVLSSIWESVRLCFCVCVCVHSRCHVTRPAKTVSNDAAILYDCLITFQWLEDQLNKSVILGGLSLSAISDKTITSRPSGQFNLGKGQVCRWPTVKPLYLKNALCQQ